MVPRLDRRNLPFRETMARWALVLATFRCVSLEALQVWRSRDGVNIVCEARVRRL